MKKKRARESRIAYFDCFSGISGDMVIGALLDAGASIGSLRAALAGLPLGECRISARKGKANFISGTKFTVTASGQQHGVGIEDIKKILRGSALPEKVEERCIEIFDRLAGAEARVHGTGVEEVHFHEVGATDSIVDIVGAVYLLHELGVDKVFASAPRLGRGFTTCSHGTLPVPAPATVELLKGIPVTSADCPSELVTPTGAAILSTVCSGYGGVPAMTFEMIGYGIGSRKTGEIPNCLRVMIGREAAGPIRDEVDVVMANLDDISPQVYELVMERLYERGALEVYLQSAQMKKNRPGVLVTVISPPQEAEGVADILFRETGTLGIRITRARRLKLEREAATVETDFGPVRVKVSRDPGGRLLVRPEYDDVKRIAVAEGLPLIEVHDRVMEKASSLAVRKRVEKRT